MVTLSVFSKVGGERIDTSVVKGFNIFNKALLSVSVNQVDSETLTTETSRTTNSVDVVLTLAGNFEVDNNRHLLNIDTTGQEISGNKNTTSTRTEFLEDKFTILLLHISVSGGNSKALTFQETLELFNTSSGVAVDDSLRNGQLSVNISQHSELLIVISKLDVELLNTVESELFLLDQNTNRVAHELIDHLESLGRESGREESQLQRRRSH